MSLIIVIRNVSSLAPISDYVFEVLVGDGSPSSKTISRGKILGHKREEGWEILVEKMLRESRNLKQSSFAYGSGPSTLSGNEDL